MARIPIEINEGELVEVLSARVSATHMADNTSRWQARLMLHVGELLEGCREVADAQCIYSGRGGHTLTVSQNTRRKAREILRQLERRTDRQALEDLPPITVRSV
jgi:hypothetical protein